MPRFTYDDIVRVKDSTAVWIDVPDRRTTGPRHGEKCWVFAVIEDRKATPLPRFPAGVVYGVEFEDGDAIELHEDDLELVEASGS